MKGTNMKMATVCSVFLKAGMQEVSAVLASGNILFSSKQSAEDLNRVLAKAMADHFSYEAFLFVKNRAEIETIVLENPFDAEADYHVYSFVGQAGIEKVLLSEFERGEQHIGEEAQLVNGNFYWKVPKGSSVKTDLGKVLGKKKLKDSFTSRNINTMERVLNKM